MRLNTNASEVSNSTEVCYTAREKEEVREKDIVFVHAWVLLSELAVFQRGR